MLPDVALQGLGGILRCVEASGPIVLSVCGVRVPAVVLLILIQCRERMMSVLEDSHAAGLTAGCGTFTAEQLWSGGASCSNFRYGSLAAQ